MARGKKTDVAQIDRQNAKIKVLELRGQYLSFRAISAQLGIGLATAHDYFREAMTDLKAVETREALEVRIIETENLDLASAAIREKVLAGDLPAIDRWLRISIQRAALWGAPAPVNQNVNLLMNAQGGIDIEPVADYRAAIASLAPGGDDEQ